MQHTAEPWATNAKGQISSGDFSSVDGATIIGKCFSYKDARRIVACVNYCAGIETEALEKSGVGLMSIYEHRDELANEIDRIRQQNAELVQLLKVIKIEGEITRITTLFSLESAIFNHQTEPTT